MLLVAHLYGTQAKIDEIKKIATAHGAVIVEDEAESLGVTYKGKEIGSFGDYGCISFNENKIITGSSGGMFITDSKADAEKVCKLVNTKPGCSAVETDAYVEGGCVDAGMDVFERGLSLPSDNKMTVEE